MPEVSAYWYCIIQLDRYLIIEIACGPTADDIGVFFQPYMTSCTNSVGLVVPKLENHGIPKKNTVQTRIAMRDYMIYIYIYIYQSVNCFAL